MIKRQCGRIPARIRDAVVAFAVLLAGTAVAQPVGSSRLTSFPDGVAVRINQVVIGESEIEERLERLYPSSVAHGGLRPEKLAELRSKAIHELVIEELAWQKALKTGQVVPASEARAEQRRWRAKFGAAEFDAALRERGITVSQYVRKLQKQLTVRRMVRQNVELPSRISQPELERYYQQNKDKLYRPERVRLQLFLVALDPSPSSDAEREAKKKIDGIYQQLQAGKDFSELAYQFSEDMYRATGGEVGWMHKGSLDPEFETLAFSLPIGAISAPLRTPSGYNILKVEDRESARQLRYGEVRGRLRAELAEKKINEFRKRWEAQLTSGAQIEFPKAVEVNGASGLAPAREH